MVRQTVKFFASVALAAASANLLVGCSSEVAVHDSPAVSRWVCSWDPTMNHDWHDDDYSCTNGTDFERPHLIPGDGFVTREEVDRAAAAYEAQLNS
jgi:hypothetical protein